MGVDKLYTLSEVARIVGVTRDTIANWEKARYIPQAFRMGLNKKRVWSRLKVEKILEFAKDNGYLVSDRW